VILHFANPVCAVPGPAPCGSEAFHRICLSIPFLPSTQPKLGWHKVMVQPRLTLALAIAVCVLSAIPTLAVDVSIPASPPDDVIAVKGNFLGVSFELSAFDKYCEFHLNSRPMVVG